MRGGRGARQYLHFRTNHTSHLSLSLACVNSKSQETGRKDGLSPSQDRRLGQIDKIH